MFQIFLFNFVHFVYFSEILMANIIHKRKRTKSGGRAYQRMGKGDNWWGFFKKIKINK